MHAHMGTHMRMHTHVWIGEMGGDGQEEWARDIVRLVLHTCVLGSIPARPKARRRGVYL